MNEEKPKIACLPNGPYYLLTDTSPREVPYLQTSQGESCSTVTGVALCRCGGSSNKPFCDGTHGRIGFSDENLTDGSSTRLDNYFGQKINIHDNRSICAHAGLCTDNLKSVFKYGEEPWIDPDGAAVEDIVAIVEKCPSGALSFSIEDVDPNDQERDPMITVTKNGPYAVVGGMELIGHELAAGASTEHFTLCRCGASKNKPFCDGSHWSIGFEDDSN